MPPQTLRCEFTLADAAAGVRPTSFEMDLTTPEALEFVVQAYIQAASEREDLELLHLLSTSPDDLPPSSDDNSDDDLPSFVRGGSERGQEDHLGVQPRPQDKGSPKGSTVILFLADAQMSFRFTREAVPTIADGVTGASTLSALLKGGRIGAGSDSSGKQLQIRVFGQPIPGDPMVVLVPEAATMAEVISLVLDLVSPDPTPSPKPGPNPSPHPHANPNPNPSPSPSPNPSPSPSPNPNPDPNPNPNEVISLVIDQYVRAHSCEALCLESADFELLMVRATTPLVHVATRTPPPAPHTRGGAGGGERRA